MRYNIIMPTYQKYCPQQPKKLKRTFNIPDGREPAPTQGCICQQGLSLQVVEYQQKNRQRISLITVNPKRHDSQITKID